MAQNWLVTKYLRGHISVNVCEDAYRWEVLPRLMNAMNE